jgi:hypothetical protein
MVMCQCSAQGNDLDGYLPDHDAWCLLYQMVRLDELCVSLLAGAGDRKEDCIGGLQAKLKASEKV